jgi:hypothetical protein
MIKLKS